jgi:hypothetical protein
MKAATRALCGQRSFDGGDRTLDIGVNCLPIANRDTHAARTTPGCPAKECFAAIHDARNDLVGPRIMIERGCTGLGTEKPDQPLVDRGCPHDLSTPQGPNTRHEDARVMTRPINEICDAPTSQLPDGGIGGNAACTA